MQAPWRLTICSDLFLRVLVAYNSRILSFNASSGVTTFEVTDPRFALKQKEDNVVNIAFLADVRANPHKVRRKCASAWLYTFTRCSMVIWQQCGMPLKAVGTEAEC